MKLQSHIMYSYIASWVLIWNLLSIFAYSYSKPFSLLFYQEIQKKSNRKDWRYRHKSNNAVALKGGHSQMDSDDYYLFQCKDGRGKLFSAKPDSLELLLPNKKKPQILQVNNSGTGTHTWACHSPSKKMELVSRTLISITLILIKKVLFHLFHSFVLFPLHFPLPSAFTDNFLSITSKLTREKKWKVKCIAYLNYF